MRKPDRSTTARMHPIALAHHAVITDVQSAAMAGMHFISVFHSPFPILPGLSMLHANATDLFVQRE